MRCMRAATRASVCVCMYICMTDRMRCYVSPIVAVVVLMEHRLQCVCHDLNWIAKWPEIMAQEQPIHCGTQFVSAGRAACSNQTHNCRSTRSACTKSEYIDKQPMPEIRQRGKSWPEGTVACHVCRTHTQWCRTGTRVVPDHAKSTANKWHNPQI